MFTMNNTEGFSQEVLDKMNAEVKKRLAKIDPKSKNYKKAEEEIENEVFDEFCNTYFTPSIKL
ncbi:MAG: hypothetical protein GX362_01895 [Methanosarcinaceae archaeon]|nr:hypothetical protein [Methanosarcinaceae archaeon]